MFLHLQKKNCLKCCFFFKNATQKQEKETFLKVKDDLDKIVPVQDGDKRLAFQVYAHIVGPLLSGKSSFTDASIVDDDDFE